MRIKKKGLEKGLISCAIAAAAVSAALTLPALAGSVSAAEAEAAAISAADAVTLYDTGVSYADVTPTDHIADYPLKELKIDYFRLKMLVPDLEEGFSAAETNKEIHDKLFDNYGIGNKQDILNYADYYGGNATYLYNGSSKNDDITFMVMYEENNYTRYIGEYARLNEDEIKDICENTDYMGSGDTVYARAINGKTFLCQISDMPDTQSTTYVANTIIGGGMYSFYINLSDASEIDDNTIDTIFRSIHVKGTAKEYYDTASRLFATILAVICGILLIVTALLCFFIYRFNAFAKAAGSSFSIIGFNLPPKDAEPDTRVPAHKNDRHR